MAKQESGARPSLVEAGLQLFRERGYDGTTAAEIAARANVTERTFFRHFKDKREVLFGGETVLREALLKSIGTAPKELGPWDMLFRAFRSVLPLLEGNRSFSEPRQEIISTTPALQERELAKHAALADALTDALKARGVAHQRAVIAAKTGMPAFVCATTAWLDDPAHGLGRELDLVEADLRAIARDHAK